MGSREKNTETNGNIEEESRHSCMSLLCTFHTKFPFSLYLFFKTTENATFAQQIATAKEALTRVQAEKYQSNVPHVYI